MRRKPTQHANRPHNAGGSSGGGHRRHHNNGGGHQQHGGGSRPRKNYPQLREKYLNQAREAMSSGDRVMAEYYFQHADHYYRMMVEEGYRPHSETQGTVEQNSNESPEGNAQRQPAMSAEEVIAENPGAMPAFLTMGFTAAAAANNVQQAAKAPAQAADWEEN